MSIDVSRALKVGLERTAERNGAMLFVLFLIPQVIGDLAYRTILKELFVRFIRLYETLPDDQKLLPPEVMNLNQIREMARTIPLAVPVQLEVAISVMLVAFVLGETVRIIADRTFVSEERATLTEPTRRIVRATLSSVLSVLILLVLVLLLYLPTSIFLTLNPLLGLLWIPVVVIGGIWLIVSVFFFRQRIAVEDVGAITALSESRTFVSGARISVFALGLTLFAISQFIGLLSSLLFGGGVPAAIIGILVGAGLLTFGSAVAAQAYRQLQEDDDEDDHVDADGTPDDGDSDEWKPDEEWNDPPSLGQ